MSLSHLNTPKSVHTRRRTIVTIASAMSSLLVHGGVLAAVLYWIDHKPGAIELPTEAISVELIASEVIEAVEAPPMVETAASPSSVQSSAGAEHDSSSAAKLATQEPREQVAATEVPLPSEMREERPDGRDILQGAHEDAVLARELTDKSAAAPKSVEKPSAVKQPKPVKTAKLAEQDTTNAAETHTSRKGGAQSRTIKGSATSPSRISASAGSVLNYAAFVRARLAARKPAGGGRRGTVVVAFALARSGGLSSASISRSSGDPGLDRSVLAAVRGAGPFPTPPPGASLRFAMPFYFR